MVEEQLKDQPCIIIGASHAGVNCAFALRREGWEGDILLIDADPHLPYHRPPLSKSFLTAEVNIEQIALRPAEAYEKQSIERIIGRVSTIDCSNKQITLVGGTSYKYHKLVLATGARALIPNIPGLQEAGRVYVLRTATDISNIRQALVNSTSKRVLVIGGGYIGLELAASLSKLGAKIQVLEREERILARVTAPEMSQFFVQLHQSNGVEVCTGKSVVSIHEEKDGVLATCEDGSEFRADLIVLGVGIKVNAELAAECGLAVENGIKVDVTTRTSDKHIYAIGDCSYHYNAYYQRDLRLESVQNAVDQAKVTAANICGKRTEYNSLPWFWSDQYDVKLQTVGLFNGHDVAVLREEAGKENCFSIWYFKEDRLLAVDAVNNAKAYVVGMKLLKERRAIDRSKLTDNTIPLKPALLVL